MNELWYTTGAMMERAIQQFSRQFAFRPVIQFSERLKKRRHAVLLGMGGSHLAADCLLAVDPSLSLLIHNDYGLPPSVRDADDTLFIASSYSGNTEEVIDGLNAARKKKYTVAIISIGGRLLEIAKKGHLPYVEIPDIGIQPRMSLGFMGLAILKLLGKEKMIREARGLSETMRPSTLRIKGRHMAQRLKDHVPVVYSSKRNAAIAMNWKMKLNETGKIPAFWNVLPEANHNEMTGFDVMEKTRRLSERFSVYLLTDVEDHPRVQKRMKILTHLYRVRGLPVAEIPLSGKNRWERVFNALLLADWFALETAHLYSVQSEQVPMVEEFKKLMNEQGTIDN